MSNLNFNRKFMYHCKLIQLENTLSYSCVSTSGICFSIVGSLYNIWSRMVKILEIYFEKAFVASYVGHQ